MNEPDLPDELFFVLGSNPSRKVKALRYTEAGANIFMKANSQGTMRKFRAKVVWEEVTA